MKRKTIIVALAALLAVGAASAQTKDKLARPWFAAIGGGINMWWGDNFRDATFGELTTPQITAYVGYWFRPALGVRVKYDGYSANSVSEKMNDYVKCGSYAKSGMHIQEFGMTHIHADLLWNLSATVCQYPRRFYELIPYLGVGAIRTYRNDTSRLLPIATFGLLNKFRLSRRLDLHLDLSACATPDKADLQVTEIAFDTPAGASLALSYKF